MKWIFRATCTTYSNGAKPKHSTKNTLVYLNSFYFVE